MVGGSNPLEGAKFMNAKELEQFLTRYRESVKRALDARWLDGVIDGASASTLAYETWQIEEDIRLAQEE